MRWLCLLLLAGACTACGVKPVKAWQRGALAQPVMAWDVDALAAQQRAHTQFSKEAASGGASLGGGGCGCN